MLDLSWGEFDKPFPVTTQTKKCRYCKLIKPHYEFGRWPDCKGGLYYFCTECWEGFRGLNDGEKILVCSKCDNQKPLAEFYREHVFGKYSPWCNSCRKGFIESYMPPKEPRKYKCYKCHEKRNESEFSQANGIRSQYCKQCRQQSEENRLAPKESPKPTARVIIY